MSSRSAGGTAYDRREQLDLESAIAASTSLSTQQHSASVSVAPLHRLPSLHGTLDNSSYPNPTGTTTTDEIASFGTTTAAAPRHLPMSTAGAAGGRGLLAGTGKGSIGTPLSEIQSFGEDTSGRGNARPSAHAAGGAGEGEDDDFEDVVQDSEGDDNALGLSPPSAHNNKPAPGGGPLDAPDYDWSLPSPSTTTSSSHLPAAPPLPLPLALPSKKRESPFSIVVPPAGNNGGPSSKKPPTKKSSKAKPTSSTTALSKEFIDSDDEDEVAIVPAAKKARVIIDDEDDDDEVEVGDPETDYDELPIATKPKPKKRPTTLPPSASESSDPIVGGRRSRSRSLSHSLPPPTNSLPPAPKPKAAPKRRPRSPARSSDGEGFHEIMSHVREQEMKDEADDDDFGVGPKKKKRKAAPRKKAAPKEPKEPKPKRVKKPTKKELAESARLAKIQEEEAAAAGTGAQDEDEDAPMPDAEVSVAGPGPGPAPAPSADLQPPPPAPADDPPLPQKSTTNRAPSSTSASASTSTSAAPIPAPAKKKAKSRAQVIASSPSSSSSSSSQAEVAPPLPAAKAKDKGKGKGVESRIEAVMAAALADEDALGLKATKAAKKTAAAGDESNDENVAPVRKPSTSTASGSGSGTPIANFKARLVGSGPSSSSNRSPSLGPSSSTKKGLAGVMEKKSLWGHRAPGMSSKVKVPRLHMNLKPPPPPKPPVPKEKARVKKGHEEYSDEEKPWYETKHPEEWDDDDREKFAKVQKRREKGWDSN